MPELFLEILSEDIPARMQLPAELALKAAFEKRLTAQGLSYSAVDVYSTPRRLVLHIPGLPETQPSREEETKGPKVDALEQAVAGFLRANGLNDVSECQIRETSKGKAYFHVKRINGRPTSEVITTILRETLQSFSWSKSMRWGEGEFAWARPLTSITMRFAGKKILAQWPEFLQSQANDNGFTGHRFLAPELFQAETFKEYQQGLTERHVILNRDKRREMIMAQVNEILPVFSLTLKPDDALMEEVIGLVEYPQVMLGEIDAEFMQLPPEVLTAAMRSHQRYFTLLDKDGNFADKFLFVANMPDDGQGRGQRIVEGNERVLRARLSDAMFFWEQDRKHKLESFLPKLEAVTFHAKVGSVAQRVERITGLAKQIAPLIKGCDEAQAARAAKLCKADLVTGMVDEFPELQGLMGSYYAKADGEDDAVAQAIAEHYRPQGPDDAVPIAPVSVAVALADKLEVMISLFKADLKPTGSKDPFALRRAAIGVIRLLVENEINLDLMTTFDDDVCNDLIAFIEKRMSVALRNKGLRHDVIDAVLNDGHQPNPYQLSVRAKSLQAFVNTQAGQDFTTAYKRVDNILSDAKKKKLLPLDTAWLLETMPLEPAEIALQDAIEQIKKQPVFEDNKKLKALTALTLPLNTFFDDVMVNSEDEALRNSRYGLLGLVQFLTKDIADFAQIMG